ncbi:hypothetical protein BH18GEM1_BH18GEM1_22690 [soil metagenome]
MNRAERGLRLRWSAGQHDVPARHAAPFLEDEPHDARSPAFAEARPVRRGQERIALEHDVGRLGPAGLAARFDRLDSVPALGLRPQPPPEVAVAAAVARLIPAPA